MNANPVISCLVVAVSGLIAFIWLCLLLASLFFRPSVRQTIIGSGVVRGQSDTPAPRPARRISPFNRLVGPSSIRLLEAMLIVASALMFFAVAGLYLVVAARQV